MNTQSSQNDIEAILPDFGRLKYSKNPDENFRVIQAEFIRSARSILLDYKLAYEGHRWPITALELYFYHSTFWPDETTHFFRFKQRQQLERGTWYVHRDAKPAPNRSGIDITAGCESKEIAAGLLISAIGERPGSATAFKAIVRQGMDYVFRRNDKWSDKDRSVIETINKKSISEGVLTLKRRKLKAPEKELWIGPRKLGEDQGNTEFGKRCLRVATFKTTTPPMKKLLDEIEISQ